MNKDTFNVTDGKGQKQGKWMEFGKKANITRTFGSYKNNLKEGIWIGYDTYGRERERLYYHNGEDTTQGKKFRRIEAAFGDERIAGTTSPYLNVGLGFYISTSNNNKTSMEWDTSNYSIANHVKVDIYELNGTNKKFISSYNTNDTCILENIKFELNKIYLVHCSMKGFIPREIEINTHNDKNIDSVETRMVYANVGFFKKFTSELSADIMGKPSKVFKYFIYHALMEDKLYFFYWVNQFNSLDPKTKERMIKQFDDKYNDQIIELTESKKKNEEQIELLSTLNKLKSTEARNNMLIAQAKEKELNLLSKTELINNLKLERQELELKNKEIEKEKMNTLLNAQTEEGKRKEEEIAHQKNVRNLMIIGLLMVSILVFVIFNSLQKNKKANAIIKNQKELVEIKNHEIQEKQNEILDSINYAKRIQYTLLAHADFLKQHIPQHFVLFHPKDIVSGDFYWAATRNDKFYLAVCDSTGHGVPGAFMSLLNIGFLSEAINEKGIEEPHHIFDHVRQRLIENISKEGQKDGFDGILLCFDKTLNTITYSAANNAPIIVVNNELIELESDRMPVGIGERKQAFQLWKIPVQKNNMIYLYTDGYADQFGGPRGKKFMYKRLNEKLNSISTLSLEAQHNELIQTFNNWKGNLEQVDDVCVLGIRI